MALKSILFLLALASSALSQDSELCDACADGVVSPVCASDFQSYANECVAVYCNGVGVLCYERCPCSDVNSCQCPEYYQPLCGTDDFTYSNECFSGCVAAEIQCNGACPCPDCTCTDEWLPVCAENGETFGNRCEADCRRWDIVCEGECPCDEK